MGSMIPLEDDSFADYDKMINEQIAKSVQNIS
jgi:hypothetical protein